ALSLLRKPYGMGQLWPRTLPALGNKRELDRRSKREDRLKATTKRLVAVSKTLENESRIDPLTGILNRRAFTTTFDVAWQRASMTASQLSLLMVDVDGFHGYN